MKRSFIIQAPCAVLALSFAGCVAGIHGGADAGESDRPPFLDQVGDQSPAVPTGDGAPKGDAKPDPNPIDCPDVPQHLLILDFRSGWWNGAGAGGEPPSATPAGGVVVGGDGGTMPVDAGFSRKDGFVPTIFPLIADPCPGTRIEYHHILRDQALACHYPVPGGAKLCTGNAQSVGGGGPEIVFGESDWNSYTQIWILSGSEKDSSDLGAASDLFKKIANASKAACLPFFLGFGSGFVDHGNRAAEKLGFGVANELATTTLPIPNFWIYSPDVVTVSTIGKAGLKPHVLFTDVDGLADVLRHTATVANEPITVEGDGLNDHPLVEVIAKDSAGRSTIGVGRIPATKDLMWGRPFVLDGGIQRFYMVDKNGHQGTLKYLRNLTNYLGSIGCRSTEPPIIVP